MLLPIRIYRCTVSSIYSRHCRDLDLVSSLRGMTQSASVFNPGAHSFRRLGSQKLPCFFNFPVSRARPEKLCDFYWLQLQITCKSGWIAQGEKIYCVSKEGKSKLTAYRRMKTQGCALDLTARDLASGDFCIRG